MSGLGCHTVLVCVSPFLIRLIRIHKKKGAYLLVEQAVLAVSAAEQEVVLRWSLWLLANLAFVLAQFGARKHIYRVVSGVAQGDERASVRQSLLLTYLHLGRFAFWVPVGALVLLEDPLTASIFLVLRPWAATYQLKKRMLKKDRTLSHRELNRRAWGIISPLIAGSLMLVLVPTPQWVESFFRGGVLVCFLALPFATLRQVQQVLRDRGGYQARRFQFWMLWNYLFMFGYSWTTDAPGLGTLLATTYGIASVSQLMLVVVIYYYRWQYKQRISVASES